MSRTLRTCCTIALLAGGAAGPALAQQQRAATNGFERELWLTTGFASQHTKHAQRYNQRNDGLGLEWRTSPSLQLNAGHYRNSVRHGSTYAQLAWVPVESAAPAGMRLRAGASVGVINGYPKVRHGGYFATFVPVVSLEWHKTVGLNLVYIPTVGKRVDGAFAVQLKLRAG